MNDFERQFLLSAYAIISICVIVNLLIGINRAKIERKKTELVKHLDEWERIGKLHAEKLKNRPLTRDGNHPKLLTHDEIEKGLDKALGGSSPYIYSWDNSSKEPYKPTQLEMEILYASNKAHGGIKCAAGHASQYGSYCRVCGVKIK